MLPDMQTPGEMHKCKRKACSLQRGSVLKTLEGLSRGSSRTGDIPSSPPSMSQGPARGQAGVVQQQAKCLRV